MTHALQLNDGIPTPAKVLIVDDEPGIVDEVIEQLEDEGMECVAAHSAAEALELVKLDTEIGVVVTDIRMPGMDGLEMARKLNKDYGDSRDLFVIVVTGHAGMKEAIEALKLGAEDFLTKPISPDHLLHSVRRAGEMISLRANERFYQNHLEREVQLKTAEARELAADLATRNKELRAKNHELTIVGRLKDEFLQMMSHELNTPLNAIMGFSQLLMETGSDKNRTCAEHIHAAGGRLMKAFDSILTLSALTAGDLPLSYTRFSARNFVDSIVADYSQVLEQWNVELHCKIPERPFDMNADFQELQKAVGHVIENAGKYGSQGGHVTLSLEQQGDRVWMEISDDGPGMTPEQVAIAMEPMRQVDGSTSRKFEGMGLGLPLALGITELHCGRLQIDSAPGKGTTVTLIVPTNKGTG